LAIGATVATTAEISNRAIRLIMLDSSRCKVLKESDKQETQLEAISNL
jgi:hypothetical protein